MLCNRQPIRWMVNIVKVKDSGTMNYTTFHWNKENELEHCSIISLCLTRFQCFGKVLNLDQNLDLTQR